MEPGLNCPEHFSDCDKQEIVYDMYTKSTYYKANYLATTIVVTVLDITGVCIAALVQEKRK